jgi:hypothetical protein
VTAVFTVGYLAFSIPALIAGVATAKFGLHPTALVYSASLAALVAVAAGILLFGPGGKPARPAPAPRAVMPPSPGPCTSPPCPQTIDPADGTTRAPRLAALCRLFDRALSGPRAILGRFPRMIAQPAVTLLGQYPLAPRPGEQPPPVEQAILDGMARIDCPSAG